MIGSGVDKTQNFDTRIFQAFAALLNGGVDDYTHSGQNREENQKDQPDTQTGQERGIAQVPRKASERRF